MLIETDYYTEIEQFLTGKRERGLLVSTADYRIMKKWEALGIPLDIVKKGIELTIDSIKFSKKNRINGIITLSSCSRRVLKLWREYREAKSGSIEEWQNKANKEISKNLIDDILKMISSLEENARKQTISSSIDSLVYEFKNELQKMLDNNKKLSSDAERVYEEIEDLKENYLEKIVLSLNEEEKNQLLSRWNKKLKKLKAINNKEYENTCKELLKIAIAERLGV
ncbi:MAG: hypothetical protein D6734_06440 [Candidatus Schekmanbacteria bacterium]|nr:MAG: hypothetical protein D6734_06440 [Candidatus Schekmanbacteria bacterium]